MAIPKGKNVVKFNTAILILSGNAGTSLLLLARNLIVARMIPVADYGIAATFAVVMAVVEMASALGLHQQIVQATEGENPRFQAALQGFQVLRGTVSGVVLFAISGPMARFLGIPEVIWAYQVLAFVPVVNALQHFDIHRMNRHMVFGPMLISGLVPALVAMLIVWPLAVWLGDWRVMLYSMLLQAVLGTLTSHLVAERPYKMVFDPAIIAQSLRFGWPLLINGFLMFLVFQGDKVIVARALGMESLAIFAMGMTLTLTPTLVMAKSAQNFLLPQLAAARGDPDRFAMLALVTIQAVLLMGLLLALGVLLVGGPIVNVLLGVKYEGLIPLLFWFALMQTFRVLKAGPAIVALARGHTMNAMVANLVRLLTLPICWQVAVTSGDLRMILWVAMAGEILGHIVALVLLQPVPAIAERGIMLTHIIAVLMLLGVSGWVLHAPLTTDAAPLLIWAVAAAGLVICLFTMRELRAYVRIRT
jgi:O-antigen/teichoic acid export membrane protein